MLSLRATRCGDICVPKTQEFVDGRSKKSYGSSTRERVLCYVSAIMSLIMGHRFDSSPFDNTERLIATKTISEDKRRTVFTALGAH